LSLVFFFWIRVLFFLNGDKFQQQTPSCSPGSLVGYNICFLHKFVFCTNLFLMCVFEV
jgi:hypothetical protein